MFIKDWSKRKTNVALASVVAGTLFATGIGGLYIHSAQEHNRECQAKANAATTAYAEATQSREAFAKALDAARSDANPPTAEALTAAQKALDTQPLAAVPTCGKSVNAAVMDDYAVRAGTATTGFKEAHAALDAATTKSRIAAANKAWGEASTLRDSVLAELDRAIAAAQAKQGFGSATLDKALAARNDLKSQTKIAEVATSDQAAQLFKDAAALTTMAYAARGVATTLDGEVATYAVSAPAAPEPEPEYSSPDTPSPAVPAPGGYAPAPVSPRTYAPAQPVQPAPVQPAPAPAPAPAPVQPAPAPGAVKGYMGIVCDGADTLRMHVSAGWTEEAARYGGITQLQGLPRNVRIEGLTLRVMKDAPW